MRVLHIMTAFPREEGDPIVPWLVEMLKRLRERGVACEVLTSSYKGMGDQVFHGIPVHRFRYFPRRWENLTHEETAPDRMRKSLLYKAMPGFYVLAGMLAAWRLGRRERYDVIHVHWPMPHALLGKAAQLATGAPVVSTFYSVEVRWIAKSLPLLTGLLRWTITSPAQAVAISTSTAEEMKKLADVSVDVIPYTVALPPSPARTRARGGTFRALFVGRLVERKGVHVLIDAVAALPRSLDVQLVVCGDGPERPRLEALARERGVDDRVEFAGRVSDERLRSEYAEADAFVLPAVVDARGDTEGLGVVLLEAMNSRVPVIASDAGGITDIVEHERTGLLVPPGDAAALAEALRRLAEHPAEAEALGEAGYRRLTERFTWDAIVSKWIAIYERVTAGRTA